MILTEKQKKALVMQWEITARELRKIKDAELSDSEYDWRIVDALLEIGALNLRSINTSGLVEMQRLFMSMRNKGSGK